MFSYHQFTADSVRPFSGYLAATGWRMLIGTTCRGTGWIGGPRRAPRRCGSLPVRLAREAEVAPVVPGRPRPHRLTVPCGDLGDPRARVVQRVRLAGAAVGEEPRGRGRVRDRASRIGLQGLEAAEEPTGEELLLRGEDEVGRLQRVGH